MEKYELLSYIGIRICNIKVENTDCIWFTTAFETCMQLFNFSLRVAIQLFSRTHHIAVNGKTVSWNSDEFDLTFFVIKLIFAIYEKITALEIKIAFENTGIF